jgi:hypothetical protein
VLALWPVAELDLLAPGAIRGSRAGGAERQHRM